MTVKTQKSYTRFRFPQLNIRQMNTFYGYLFAMPWMLGFLLFTATPIIQAIQYSLMDYNILQTPKWIGINNYVNIMSDKTFYLALYNTFYYVIFSVPLGIVIGLMLAMLLNNDIKGVAFYRTLYYLPSIVPLVAASVMWVYIFRPNNGLLTLFVKFFGVRSPVWLADPDWAKPSLIIVSLWSAGGGLIIYLAGLKNIPRSYYESAELDGANAVSKFFHITIPLLTPTLLFQLIMGLIGAFQVFTQAFIITAGGPNQATYFYAFYIFDNAFKYWKMGYASALAWVLFVIIMTLTALNMYFSKKWVHYL